MRGKRTRFVATKLRPSEYEDLAALADLLDLTISELMRGSILHYIQETKMLGHLESPENRLPELAANV